MRTKPGDEAEDEHRRPLELIGHTRRPYRDSGLQPRLAPRFRGRGGGYPGGVPPTGRRGAPRRQHRRARTGGEARPGHAAGRRKSGGSPRGGPRMTALGYRYRGENGISGRFYFEKAIDGRTVAHVHMFPPGHPASGRTWPSATTSERTPTLPATTSG